MYCACVGNGGVCIHAVHATHTPTAHVGVYIDHMPRQQAPHASVQHNITWTLKSRARSKDTGYLTVSVKNRPKLT